MDIFDLDQVKDNEALETEFILGNSDGKIPDDSYTYLASTWATPQLDIDGEIIDCYKMQSETDGWDSGTFWPDSAKDILKSGD